MKRSDQQNKALHVWFRLVANELRDQDFDFRSLHVPIAPTEYLVKELMWKPVERAMYGKTSTTELSRSQVGEVYDQLNRALIERLGVSVPFPEVDTDQQHSEN